MVLIKGIKSSSASKVYDLSLKTEGPDKKKIDERDKSKEGWQQGQDFLRVTEHCTMSWSFSNVFFQSEEAFLSVGLTLQMVLDKILTPSPKD